MVVLLPPSNVLSPLSNVLAADADDVEAMRRRIEEEERLDLVHPFRHLGDGFEDLPAPALEKEKEKEKEKDDDVDGVDVDVDVLIPRQPPSDLGQTRHLVFGKEYAAHGTGREVAVRLTVDARNGCGGSLWPAGEVLASYLCQNAELLAGAWAGRTVVELGSGTGLVGVALSKLERRARIWVTDMEPLLPLLRKNVALNDAGEHVRVANLTWGLPIGEGLPLKPDVILAADCVYLEAAFQPLVDTLIELSTPDTLILFSYKKRRKADRHFFVKLKKHFFMEEVDDPAREVYRRQSINVWRLRPRTHKSHV